MDVHFNSFTVNYAEKCIRFFRNICTDSGSRNLFLFLCLNASFAFVELAYGFWTNSLSLVSDAFHMFFDCSALVTGLVASVISKWSSNERFSYGYVRAEVLGGFANAILLLFVAFFVLSEAIERLAEPPEVKHDRLFIVSVLGFIVNLIGIFAFNHGGLHHGHTHGHSHAHSHGHGHAHSRGHGHGHDGIHEKLESGIHWNQNCFRVPHSNNHAHSNKYDGPNSRIVDSSYSLITIDSDQPYENSMDDVPPYHVDTEENTGAVVRHNRIIEGVFLHIVADTLGSVGVIISSLLMHYFNWMIVDPICSLCISFLIITSAYPLLRDTLSILMMRTPREIEDSLPVCYNKLARLPGVRAIRNPHFWTLCSERYVGTLELQVDEKANLKYILNQAKLIFYHIGVKDFLAHLEFVN